MSAVLPRFMLSCLVAGAVFNSTAASASGNRFLSSVLFSDTVLKENAIQENAIQENAIENNDLEPKTTDSIDLELPLGDRYGIEYSIDKNQSYSDMVSLSFLSRYENSDQSANRYSFAKPVVFRVTLKGYSLFQSEQGENYFFSLDKAREKEIRSPRFLLSLTKHF
ncbi:hypothetical protein [Pleionea mediterranea]|nr:hypothetical protein [Pleionea mediterranea]